MAKFKDLTGMVFGRLTCIGPAGRDLKDKRKRLLWRCKCACGNECVVRGCNLMSGNTRSCGCLQRERTSRSNTIHGMSRSNGGREHPLYVIWKSMKQRCCDPNHENYRWYGARGIRVCDEWMDFDSFRRWALANGYREGLSIDRIDNNGNYEPQNCRWVPPAQQAINRRCVRLLTFNGQTKPLPEWAREFGMKPDTLRYRLKRGMTVEQALLTPLRERRRPSA